MREISVVCPNCKMKKIKTEDGFKFDVKENGKWIRDSFLRTLRFPKCYVCYEGSELKFEDDAK